MNISKETVTNVLLTVVAACIGWLFIAQYNQAQRISSTEATRFTQEHGDELRHHLTSIFSDVDKRLAVMENNINWLRDIDIQSVGIGAAVSDSSEYQDIELPPAPEISPPEGPFAPRYQIEH